MLRDLCRQYRADLVGGGSATSGQQVPYLWATLANGVVIDVATRRLVAAGSDDGDPADHPPDVSVDGGLTALMSWLAAPDELRICRDWPPSCTRIGLMSASRSRTRPVRT